MRTRGLSAAISLGYEEVNLASLINKEATKSDFEKYFESLIHRSL